ncbi:MAG: hypothetical protein KDJ97_34200, partial [Anaerolineae bacterium]|nr:hypothetical protein [Anaerolineae bacterium]
MVAVMSTPEPLLMVSVQAKRAGRRRAGRAWPATLTEIPARLFSDEQLQQLLDDPELITQVYE